MSRVAPGDMPPLELKRKQVAVFGLKGTGKSNLLQYLLTEYPGHSGHLCYDVCQEHDSLNTYQPTHRAGDEAEAELAEVTKRMVTNLDRDRRPEIYAVEEMSRFCGSHSPPPDPVYDLVDLARHYDCGIVTVARRPAQVHSDITELADTVIVYPMAGANDRRKLNNMLSGVGDYAVDDLPEYHFIRIEGRDWTVHSPVPEMDTTGRL